MGCDIYGWIETASEDVDWPLAERPESAEGLDRWRGALDITAVAGRNYALFACRFGVRNSARFRPVAAERGRPPAPSAIVSGEFARIDALERDWGYGEFHSYTRVTWAELAVVDWDELGQVPPEHVRGYVPGPDGHPVALRGPLRHSQAIDTEWEVVLTLMRHLSGRWGAERVRLGVWFDG